MATTKEAAARMLDVMASEAVMMATDPELGKMTGGEVSRMSLLRMLDVMAKAADDHPAAGYLLRLLEGGRIKIDGS